MLKTLKSTLATTQLDITIVNALRIKYLLYRQSAVMEVKIYGYNL